MVNLHRKKLRMALRIYEPFTNKFYSYIKIYQDSNFDMVNLQLILFYSPQPNTLCILIMVDYHNIIAY